MSFWLHVQTTADDIIQHYSFLYVKYLQAYQKLQDCYDQHVHPQKRIDIKVTLESVMSRLIEIKDVRPRPAPQLHSPDTSGGATDAPEDGEDRVCQL